MRTLRLATAGAALAAAGLALPLLATPAAAAPALQITYVRYDTPGPDRPITNARLNGEYVVIKNLGGMRKELTNATVRDGQNHVYRFGPPRLVLRPGAKVTLHTGNGRDDSQHRYWRQRNYIWNNSNDKAILRGPAGVLLDTCAWGPTGPGFKVC